jgi:hypothetical protein
LYFILFEPDGPDWIEVNLMKLFTIALFVCMTSALTLTSFAGSKLTFEKYAAESIEETENKQTSLIEKYKFDQWEDFNVDSQTGKITFSKKGKSKKFVADTICIGSFSKITNTWLWNWAGDPINAGEFYTKSKDLTQKLQRFGKENGYNKMMKRKFASNPDEIGQLVGIAVRILNGIGYYAVPGTVTDLYFVITKVSEKY